jgi:hypothetical protein
MMRFLVFALVGALCVAGSTALALGDNKSPPSPAKPQPKKGNPTPTPGKKSPPGHKSVVIDVPKGGPQPTANKNPAKPGNGSKPGAGSYSLADYKRDLDKGVKEQQDGTLEELPADLQILGGAVGGGGAGAIGGVIKSAPQLVHGKYLQAKGEWDMTAATGKFIWSWLSDKSNANPRIGYPGK